MLLPIDHNSSIQALVFNPPPTPFPDNMLLQEALEQQTRQHPDKTALSGLGYAMTYRRLNTRANQLAGRLRQLGAGPGTIIALLLPRSAERLVAVFGVLKAGAAYLPLSMEDPPGRIAELLTDAGADLLLCTTNEMSAAAALPVHALDLSCPDSYTEEEQDPLRPAKPTDPAYLIYTSGSTGRPKGVLISHRAVVNRLYWMQQQYPLGPEDRLLHKTPYYFDVSVWELFWWTFSGSSLAIAEPGAEKIPLLLISIVQREQVTHLHFVPAMLSVFLEYAATSGKLRDLRSLRRIFSSGEALSPALLREFNKTLHAHHATCLTNLYGPTEATIDVTAFDCPPGEDLEVVPIGKPVANTHILILHNGQVCSPGQPGEICIGGACLALGYWRRPDLTAKAFIDHPWAPSQKLYRSGDQGYWRTDGQLIFLGRQDQQVKIRGIRVELTEIEAKILEFDAIRQCAVVLQRYSPQVTPIIAYVRLVAGGSVSGLNDFLKQHLPPYMMPHRIVVVESFPLTRNGKLDRSRLPQPEW